MAQKKAARYVEVRARLRFHEDLDTGLYELISSTPEGLRGELLHTLLTRAAPTMGLQTKVPWPAPFQTTAASSAATANAPAAETQQVAVVREPKQSAPPPTSTEPTPAKHQHSTDISGNRFAGMEALGIRSQADWDDTFDYSKPPR